MKRRNKKKQPPIIKKEKRPKLKMKKLIEKAEDQTAQEEYRVIVDDTLRKLGLAHQVEE